jgi:hypothetical protein
LSESWVPEIGPPSSMSGGWKRMHGRAREAPNSRKAGSTDRLRPKHTAPPLDSTQG